MKLLIAATDAVTVETFLLPYARHFRQRGWAVHALARRATVSASCRDAFDAVWDAPWSRRMTAFGNIRALAKVRALVKREKYQIVHVHTPIAAFVTRLALRLPTRVKGVALVYTAHGFHFHPKGNILGNFIFSRLERLAGRWTDRLVVMNRTDQGAAVEMRIVPDDRVVLVPGIGIDLDGFRRPVDKGEARRRFSLPEDGFLVAMVAEFIPRKRHGDLVSAAVLSRIPNLHVVFAGRGPLEPQIRRMVGQLGLGARASFLGFVEDIPVLLHATDVLVLPSSQEGLPRCVIEALAVGVPVVASNVRGNSDLLERGVGALYRLGDTSELAEALRRVNQNGIRDGGRSDSTGSRDIDRFDIRRLLKLHSRLYEGILADSAKRSASARTDEPIPPAQHRAART